MPRNDSDVTQQRLLRLVMLCFFLSGFAALVYETVWLRQFAIVLGTSQESLAIVLSSYMGGLAVGSIVAGQLANRVTRPVWLYGFLELAIAVTAILIPWGIRAAQSMQVALLGGDPSLPLSGTLAQDVFGFATTWILVLIPTAMMGATLPLLAKFVVGNDSQLGGRIGLLYGINTLGAVTGTLAAAFLCMPTLGLGRTVWVGAAANAAVFVLVIVMVKNEAFAVHRTAPVERIKATLPRAPLDHGGLRWVALLVGISGAISFGYEIVFTRMLSHFLGASVFAFATMLAGFLLGIAIGGLAASRLATDRHRAAVAFVYCQSLIAVSAALGFRWIERLAGEPFAQWSSMSMTAQQVAASIITLLPTATFVGATFPLATRVFARDETEAASGSAWTYFCNTIGAIVGSLVMGGLLMPAMKYHGAVTVAAAFNIVLAVAALFLFRISRVHGAAICFATCLLIIWRPTWPENVMRVSALNGSLTRGSLLYDHVGKASTVSVFYDAGTIRFQTNGLPEALLPPAGSGVGHLSDAVYLAAIAPLVRPTCREMLMIGLGGGVSVAAIPPSITKVDVLELEASVVDANRAVSVFRESDPLADPRVSIFINDARNALALTTKKYDAIVSQPSHPWTAGASHLYTQQYAEQVRARLNPAGVFVQWINGEFVDEQLTRSMGATLLSVFPYVSLYQPIRGTFLFVASDQPITPESVRPEKPGKPALCAVNDADRDYFRRLGILYTTHLFGWLVLDQAGMKALCVDAPLITDENNRLALKAPALLRGHDPLAASAVLRAFSPVARSIEEARALCPALDLFAYGQYLLKRQRHEFVEAYVLPHIDCPASRAMLLARATGNRKAKRDAKAILLEGFSKADENQRRESGIAWRLLNERFSIRDKSRRMSSREISRLEPALSDHHRVLYDVNNRLAKDDLSVAQSSDATLAMMSVDDIAFESSVIARVWWRLHVQDRSSEARKALAEEALRIIDQSVAFFPPMILAWYRTVAALQADQPYVALASADVLADSIALEPDLYEEGSGNLRMLARCHQTLSDPSATIGVEPWRYQEVMQKISEVLRRTYYR